MSGKVRKYPSRLVGTWLLAALLLLSAGVTSAGAYVYFFTSGNNQTPGGKRQHWNPEDFPIPYNIHNAGGGIDGTSFGQVENALKASFNVWQNIASADVEFNYRGLTSVTEVSTGSDDGINLVIFDTQTSNFIISDAVGPSVVGITVNKYSSSSGHIVDSDIIFNDREYTFTTTQPTDISQKRINLQDVATHEIGHLLGLDHTWLEHATMFPYTREGQSSVSEDDKAGISSLYPSAQFDFYQSLAGTVYNTDGDRVWGVYVSAINDSTGIEEVAALSDTVGRYNIDGLRPNTAYYLRARTVDLKHVGNYIQTGADSTVYIPQYFNGVSSRTGAELVITSGANPDYDFTLGPATLLARYDMNSTKIPTIIPLGSNSNSNYYMAVRFPASTLPQSFKVHGMSFFNNDLNMFWPRIMLTGGTLTQPDLNGAIRVTTNYVGAETAFSDVEWEPVQLTSSRTLWVVFQLPDDPFVAVGDGPAIGADSNSDPNAYQDFYISTNGGATFSPYSHGQYDLKVYLTAEITDIALVPTVELAVSSIDFGEAKVGRRTYKAYPIGNSGASTLELINMYSTNLGYNVTADNTRIEPDAVDTLRIGFKPSSAAVWSGKIELETNDPARQYISIPVTGTGVFPRVSLSAQSVAFDTVDAGAVDSSTLTIRSTGEVPLLAWGWNLDSGHYRFTAPDTLEIPAGDSASVSVRFTPLESGDHPAVFSFFTDDTIFTSNGEIHFRQHQVALSGTATDGGVVLRCDLSGDGRANVIDLLVFLLLSRHNPSDPRLDWNGNGVFTIADVVSFLNSIRDGTCPDVQSGAVLAGESDPDGDIWLAGLTPDELSWLRERVESLPISDEDRVQALAVLDAAGGGRAELPRAFSLAQNHPNPFNPSTTISFSVPEGAYGSPVSLKVYDISGRLVCVLAEGSRDPGEHTVFWDGTDERGRRQPSGVYIYRLRAGGRSFTRKMVLLK